VSGDEHVDDLAELVDRAVDVAPAAGDLHSWVIIRMIKRLPTKT
jgi:hypothetical protein